MEGKRYSVSLQNIPNPTLIVRVHEGTDASLGDGWVGWSCTVEDLGNRACILHAAPGKPPCGYRLIMEALADVGFEHVRWRRIVTDAKLKTRDYWVSYPLASYRKGNTMKVTIGHGNHDCTFHYPSADDFAVAAKNVLAKVKGDDTVDLACATHCAWVCQGYVQSVVLPHDPHPMGAAPSDEDGCKLLEQAATEAEHGDPKAMKAINWLAVLDFVIAIYQRWRNS